VLTGYESWTLLHRSAGWHPWVAWLVLLASGVAAVAVLLPVARRGLAVVALVAGLVTVTGGSAAYALSTAATPHTGSTPSAGPTVTGSDGFGRGGFPGGGGFSGRGGFPGSTGGSSSSGSSSTGGFPGGSPTGGPSANGFPGRPSGAMSGGPGNGGQSVNSALTTLLQATSTRWAAATVGSQSAGPLELSSGKAVMAIGGFSGSDAAPTLAQFEAYVRAGEIKYFVAGGFGGGARGGSGGSGSAITAWVESHFTSRTVGGMTVYDLTSPKSGS
jgi:hypothetical protein